MSFNYLCYYLIRQSFLVVKSWNAIYLAYFLKPLKIRGFNFGENKKMLDFYNTSTI